MQMYIGLNIITLVMCVITLTLAVAALMPQIKHGLQLLRDGLLWALLLGIIAFVGFIGWGRLFELRHSDTSQTTDTPISEMFDFRMTSEPKLDPLPLPTADDAVLREARIEPRTETFVEPQSAVPVVQVSKPIPRMKRPVKAPVKGLRSDFAAQRSHAHSDGLRTDFSQKTPRRRISSTSGLSR